MYAEQALLDAGFQVIGPAASADKAVSLACAEKPDVVVMDIRLLGEPDGIDAANDIFERTRIRCVFATAYSTPDVRRRAQSAAPLGWLPKPYTPLALVEAVRSAVAAARAEAR
jgi:DNA-binding NarL/FixJ family response regulator